MRTRRKNKKKTNLKVEMFGCLTHTKPNFRQQFNSLSMSIFKYLDFKGLLDYQL